MACPQRASLDELAATRPELVTATHREYLEAGAELIETVTLGANRYRLAPYGLAERASRLNRRAAQLAREAREVTGRDALVGGSVGPLAAIGPELARLREADARAAFREQLDGLLEGGIDVVVLETFSDLPSLLIALEVARVASDLPVIASLTFGEDVALGDGTTPEAAVRALADAGADVIGVNCRRRTGRVSRRPGADGCVGTGSLVLHHAQRRLAAAHRGAVRLRRGPVVLPRCRAADGRGGRADRRRVLRDDARSRAGDAGSARCGRGRRAWRRAAAPPPPRPTIVEKVASLATDDGALPATRLAAALAAGRYVVSVEINPPRSIRIERTIDAARVLRDAGVDLVNVSDSAMARVRMGALAVAFGIQHDLDLECLVHFTTRDRTLMALESELLGAHALGVRDILALTGDPPRVGDFPAARGVWDVDSIGLVAVLARLNRGEDGAGSPIGQPAGFTIACALDPTAADTATEWDRLERNFEAGAQLVMTQPLFSVDQVETMLAEARRRFGPRGFPVPVLLGVLPLVTARHAEFLHNEVPGITIPDEARAAMHAAGERGSAVGIEMADALLAQVGGEVAGTYIMPSFGRHRAVMRIGWRN